jgi:putative lipoic acid-binding regulatory protein
MHLSPAPRYAVRMSDAKLLSFPCDYPIKVMLRAGEELRERVDAIVARHADATVIASATARASAQGSFTGVTYTIRARDAGHIAALFADLKDIPGVLMVL